MLGRDHAQFGDIGLRLEVQLVDEEGLPLDLSLATLVEFKLEPPDLSGTKLRTGAKLTDGSDGVVFYATAAGDLDKIGAWRWQAHVVGPNLDRWTHTFALAVEGNL